MLAAKDRISPSDFLKRSRTLICLIANFRIPPPALIRPAAAGRITTAHQAPSKMQVEARILTHEIKTIGCVDTRKENQRRDYR
jgi:hypothetical protein